MAQMLLDIAHERDEDIPALIYEARSVRLSPDCKAVPCSCSLPLFAVLPLHATGVSCVGQWGVGAVQQAAVLAPDRLLACAGQEARRADQGQARLRR